MLDKGEQENFEVKYQEDTKHNLAPFFAVVNVHSPEMAINALQIGQRLRRGTMHVKRV